MGCYLPLSSGTDRGGGLRQGAVRGDPQAGCEPGGACRGCWGAESWGGRQPGRLIPPGGMGRCSGLGLKVFRMVQTSLRCEKETAGFSSSTKLRKSTGFRPSALGTLAHSSGWPRPGITCVGSRVTVRFLLAPLHHPLCPPAPHSHCISETSSGSFSGVSECQLGPRQGGPRGGIPPRLGQQPGYGTEEEEEAPCKDPSCLPRQGPPDSKSESPGPGPSSAAV